METVIGASGNVVDVEMGPFCRDGLVTFRDMDDMVMGLIELWWIQK